MQGEDGKKDLARQVTSSMLEPIPLPWSPHILQGPQQRITDSRHRTDQETKQRTQKPDFPGALPGDISGPEKKGTEKCREN
jgi:hypothetical protein